MNQLLYYMLQVLAASGLLYAYYHFFLRNNKFHEYNRYYLLAAVVISMLIPFLNIPVYFSQQQTDSSTVLQTLTYISYGSDVIVTGKPENSITTTEMLYGAYILFIVIALVKMGISLLKIWKLSRNNPVEKLDNIFFVNTGEPGTPFSFFRWMFWDKKIDLDTDKGQQIFRHELFHIRQKHSIDILFIELATIIFWLNPFYHLIKKEIKAIHEFLADRSAVNENEEWDYAELLLMQVLQTKHSLVNPFFHNQIKRRIAMITSSKKPSYQYLRKMMVLPLLAIVTTLFAFTYKKVNEPEKRSLAEIVEQSFSDTIPGNKKEVPGEIKGSVNGVSVKAINLKGVSIDQVLYIIDGIVQPKQMNNLDKLDPNTIATINVLKGQSAISKYGENAANGAIEIVTKQKDNSQNLRLRAYNLENDIASEPLFVIDGIEQTGIANHEAFKNIDPNSIESITVLKDASSTALYGEKGKNGVVQIITKKGIPYIVGAPVRDTTKPALKEVVVTGYATRRDAKKVPGLELKADKPSGVIEEVVVTGYPSKKVPGLQLKEDKKVSGVIEEVVVTGYATKKDNVKKVEGADLQEVVVTGMKKDVMEVVPARFEGGEDGWRKFLQRNLNSLVPVNNGAPAGVYKVVVQFIVDMDGTVSNITAKTNHGYGMEDEVIRILKEGPKWIPATSEGKSLKTFRQQPVTFVIEDESDSKLEEVVVVGYPTKKKDEPKNTIALSQPNKETKQQAAKFPNGDKMIDETGNIYPNPADNLVTIPLSTQKAGTALVQILNNSGNIVSTQRPSLAKGANNVSVNTSSLSSGAYVIKITSTDGSSRSYKMIKK